MKAERTDAAAPAADNRQETGVPFPVFQSGYSSRNKKIRQVM